MKNSTKKSIFLFILIILASYPLPSPALNAPEGIFAKMETNRGEIFFRIFYELTPITAANFIGLAEGRLTWKDPNSHGVKKSPFYDGLTFHRIIPEMMVQGGDPKGNGSGGPGYQIEHEFHPNLRHDCPGILSMLNKGANSNGSQFFITLEATPFFDDRHTIFGKIIDGLEVLGKLKETDRIIRITILRHGNKAKEYDLEHYLNRVRKSAQNANNHSGIISKNNIREKGEISRLKSIPDFKGKLDPSKIPSRDQQESKKVALEYILVTYKGALSPGEYQFYEKGDARKVAECLTRLARADKADFKKLTMKYSDSPDYKIPILKKTKELPGTLGPVFRLREGQISDPIDTKKGFMIFKRIKLNLIRFRHILISFKGARGSTQTRTKEEAIKLINGIHAKAMSGDEFSDLAIRFSDSESAKKGGFIGEIAKGTTIPVFDAAAFSLKINQISDVIPTPVGFQIIKRIE